MPISMTAPLIAALIERHGLPVLQADDIDVFCKANRHSLLFLPGDPAKYPEALDVAVVLPQLMQSLSGRFTTALVAPEAEHAVHARFGCQRWPALVLLRGDAYLGSIERMRNWDDYLDELGRLLSAEPTRAPGIGIPLAPEGIGAGGCH
jgi:hydrogenase-1 operon protein HyaE